MRSYKFDYNKFLYSPGYKDHLQAKMYSAYEGLRNTEISLSIENEVTCYTSPVADGFYVVLSPFTFNYASLVEAGEKKGDKERFKKEFLTLLSSMAFGALHEASHIQHSVFSIFEIDGLTLKKGLFKKSLVKRFLKLSQTIPRELFEACFMKVSNVIDDEAINRCLINRYQGSIKTGFLAFKKYQKEAGLDPLIKMAEKGSSFEVFINLLVCSLLYGFDIQALFAAIPDYDENVINAFKEALKTFKNSGAQHKRLNESKFRLNLSLEICLIFLEMISDELKDNLINEQGGQGSNAKADSNDQEGAGGGDGEGQDEDQNQGQAQNGFEPMGYKDFMDMLKETLSQTNEVGGNCPGFREVDQNLIDVTKATLRTQEKVEIDEDFKDFIENTFSLDLTDFVERQAVVEGEHFTPHKRAAKEAKKLAKELKRRLLRSRRGKIGYQRSGLLDQSQIIRTQYAKNVFTKRIREDRLKEFKISVLLDTSGSMNESEEDLNRASVMLDVLSRELNFPIRQYSYDSDARLVRDYISRDKSFSYLRGLSVGGGTYLPGALDYYQKTRESKKELVLILSDSDVSEASTLEIIKRLKESEFHFLYLGDSLKDFTMNGYTKKRQHHVQSKEIGQKFLEIISQSIFA